VEYPERAHDVQVGNVEIAVDPLRLDRVELYQLDDLGNRIEGGTFDRVAFMAVIQRFYLDNF